MSTRKLPLIVLMSLVTTGVVRQADTQSRPSLQGAWLVAEIRFIRADGDVVIRDPQPGLFIFGKSHYSTTWVSQQEPRKSFVSRFEPTREELAAACDALVMNSGTYELSGDRLTVRPLVSRVPEFTGGRMIYRYRLDRTVLNLEVLDEYSRDGLQAPWIRRQRYALRLIRAE